METSLQSLNKQKQHQICSLLILKLLLCSPCERDMEMVVKFAFKWNTIYFIGMQEVILAVNLFEAHRLVNKHKE